LSSVDSRRGIATAHLRYSDGMERSGHRRENLTVEEAVRRILLGCQVLPERAASLREARGLVLARDIVAQSPSPRFDTAAMDGYAVQHADVRGASPEQPVHLGVVGSISAGEGTPTAVAPGTANRVMTGAVCPEDADVVIPLELVEFRDDQIVVSQPFPAGTNIRRTGEDIAVGTVVVERGTMLGPAHLAAIAAEGHETIEVFPRPRVAVIATGDELVRPGHALEPGQIWDSNSVMVAALIEQFGGEVVMSGSVPDEPKTVLAVLRREAADGADLIVTIGGASLGDRDVLTELATDAVALECWSIAMKPGKPLVYGQIDGAMVIGLPGNPAAAFVSAIQFLRPAIVTLLGRLDIDPPTIVASATEAIANPGGRRNYLRVTLDLDASGHSARLAGPQNVANLATLSRAEGLLIIPAGIERVEPGARCDVQIIRSL
jgi:molybdopterin molybdotransferase